MCEIIKNFLISFFGGIIASWLFIKHDEYFGINTKNKLQKRCKLLQDEYESLENALIYRNNTLVVQIATTMIRDLNVLGSDVRKYTFNGNSKKLFHTLKYNVLGYCTYAIRLYKGYESSRTS